MLALEWAWQSTVTMYNATESKSEINKATESKSEITGLRNLNLKSHSLSLVVFEICFYL